VKKTIESEIIRLLEQEKTVGEIVEMGYKRSTVYGIQRKWHEQKATTRQGSSDSSADATSDKQVEKPVSLAQTEQLRPGQTTLVVPRLRAKEEQRLLDVIGLSDEDGQYIVSRIKEILTPPPGSAEARLTETDKTMIEKWAKLAFATTLDIEPQEINLKTMLWEDLGMDSLAFLEMYEEFQHLLGFDLDVNIVAKYTADHPVRTYGEFVEQVFQFIDRREDILAELGVTLDTKRLV
jgi:acyl carrier protein